MKTILLAEDEESGLALYEAMLAPHSDWRMIVAKTGPEALELATTEHPDLALLDLQMPLLDGIEVCRQLKSSPQTASFPIIVVTAFAQNSNRLAAEEAGADEFVAKPFSTALLTELVERLVGSN